MDAFKANMKVLFNKRTNVEGLPLSKGALQVVSPLKTCFSHNWILVPVWVLSGCVVGSCSSACWLAPNSSVVSASTALT